VTLAFEAFRLSQNEIVSNGSSLQNTQERGNGQSFPRKSAGRCVMFEVALKLMVTLQLNPTPTEPSQQTRTVLPVAVTSVMEGATGRELFEVRTPTTAAATNVEDGRAHGAGGAVAGAQSKTLKAVAVGRGANVTMRDAA
jgi:hypothetical protein